MLPRTAVAAALAAAAVRAWAAPAGSWAPYPPTAANCSMQQKLAQQAPFPVSVVWIEQLGDTLESVRDTFAVIKSLGFQGLKQLQFSTPLTITPDDLLAKAKAVSHAALDVGLSPWFYPLEGGYECFSLALLASLGIAPTTPPWEVQADPRMVAYQLALARARIDNMTLAALNSQLGEPGAGAPIIAPAAAPAFAAWLEAHYAGNITALQLAWANLYRGNYSAPEAPDFASAAALLTALPTAGMGPGGDYRRTRDSLRFQADALLATLEGRIAALRATDPNAPIRTGGAMLGDNQALFAWDPWGQGRLGATAGSYYISSHLPWHYSEFQHEIDRPELFQVGVAAAAGRGSWPGEWESTGGPAQYSGGQATSVDSGVMTKLLLTYIAAGMRGVGLWTFNGRQKGQEAGEYMLVDLQGRPTARARAAGAVATALQAWRWELWAASDDPLVAIFYSWENEAVAARLSLQSPPAECGFDDLDCKTFSAREANAPVLARFGWARALVDAHVPFTHVDEGDVAGGLAEGPLAGVRVLVLPHVAAMPTSLLPAIRAWQLRGGRVVADMPWLLMDAPGGLVHDQSASDAAAIFGAFVTQFHSTETPLDGQAMAVDVGGGAAPAGGGGGGGAPPMRVPRGQYAEVELAAGGVVAQAFQPPFSGYPAWVEHPAGSNATAGEGSAALVNFEAGRLHARPAALAVAPPSGPLYDVNTTLALSAWMAAVATDRGRIAPGWTASPPGVPVFLRSASLNGTSARHVFALYDDVVAPALSGYAAAVTVTVTMPWATASAADAVSGAPVPFQSAPGGPTTLTLTLPFRGGVWVRTVDA